MYNSHLLEPASNASCHIESRPASAKDGSTVTRRDDVSSTCVLRIVFVAKAATVPRRAPALASPCLDLDSPEADAAPPPPAPVFVSLLSTPPAPDAVNVASEKSVISAHVVSRNSVLIGCLEVFIVYLEALIGCLYL